MGRGGDFTDSPKAMHKNEKLGHGQSVVFYIPEEINRQLLARKRTSKETGVGVSDFFTGPSRKLG